MLLATIFLLSGAALAFAITDDEVVEEDSTTDEDVDAGHDTEAGRISSDGDQPDLIAAVFDGDQTDNEHTDTPKDHLRHLVNDDHLKEDEATPADFGYSTASVQIAVDDEALEKLPTFTADWTTHSNVVVVPAQEGQKVSIDGPANVAGSLVVMDADYVEQDSGPGGQVCEHTGINVYFVPEGEQFPEQYEWSREGATLYNTDMYSKDDDTTFGTKLLARIDMGSWTFQPSEYGNAVTLADSRIQVPSITSKFSILYI